MKLDTFFDNFGLLEDAPNGVQKLREMVLQLAVQGKLVPQDTKDESASVLLNKIKAKKERLIKEKKIKKPKQLPPIKPGEVLYELPDGWEWVRLGNVANYGEGGKISSNDIPEDAWLLDLADIEKGTSRIVQRVKFKDRISKSTKTEFKKGDVLYGKLRPYLNKVVVADDNGFCTTEIIPIRGYSGVFPKYLMYSLRSPRFLDYVDSKTYGTKMPRLGTEDAKNSLFPFPPTKEQKRIVAKVDELMTLCDELEARKQQVSINCILLNDASIHKLLTAREPKKFSKYWQRICHNFDLLYSKPENVVELRQAILQLAVQGKLVKQDPKDEPASILLEKIKAEKERLIKEKKIKKPKPLPPINPDEIPFKVPQGWCWVRLNEVFKFIDYRGKTPQKISSGVRLITAKNIRQGYINLKPEEFISEDTYEEWMTRGIPCFGDILFTTEAPLANVARVTLKEKFGLAQRAINFQPYLLFDTCFLQFALMSKVIQRLIKSKATGMTAKGIKAARLKLVIVPFPPLSEQKRIVAKVDELMTLCDELEASVSQSQKDCDRLMEAAVAEILAA